MEAEAAVEPRAEAREDCTAEVVVAPSVGTALVAVMRAKPDDGEVALNGCRALASIAAGGMAGSQAVVEAGGAAAVVTDLFG